MRFNQLDIYNIKKEALKSRLYLVLIQYISNISLPDHKPDVFHFISTTEDYGVVDQIIFHFLGGFLRWDAHYFIHIAIHGYSYENATAFFPMLPLIMKVVGKLSHLFPFISLESLILLLSVMFNILIFQFAVVTLYKLTLTIFGDKSMAFKTAFLFCYNPASIFFIAPYTECLYSLFSFNVMLSSLNLYKKYEKTSYRFCLSDGKIILETALSAITRSNGILNIGFIIFTHFCLIRKKYIKGVLSFVDVLKHIIFILLYVILSLIPFILYQIYCYNQFCTDFKVEMPKSIKNYGLINKYVLPGEFTRYNHSWCYSKIPLAYSFVQSYYWNVGLLKYYEIKQTPNFVLAAPVIIILLPSCIKHLARNLKVNVFNIFTLDNSGNNKKISMLHPILNVFVIHSFILLVFCVLFIHIQVSTRMLCSATPLIYWYCAEYDMSIKKKIFNVSSHKFEFNLVYIYFFTYFIVGTVLFSNFLPWT